MVFLVFTNCISIVEGSCRGFAYVNLETSDAQLSKCMNVLNGCSWKGGKLHISMAKPNKFNTLEDGRIVVIQPEVQESKPSRKYIPKKKRKLVRHASDQSLVTDKNVDKRKGWRRGRYGRAIASLRIRRPNRQLLIIDPSHYKNSLEKLFGSIKPKPLTRLTWTITEIVNDKTVDAAETDIMSEEDEDETEEAVEEQEYEEAVEFKEVDEVFERAEYIEDMDVDMEVVESPESIEEVVESEECTADIEVVESVDIPMDVVVESTIVEEDTVMVSSDNANVNYTQEPAPKQPEQEPKFEVNVNWSSLFNSVPSTDNASSGFSLNSMIEKSKIKDVSMDELFKKNTVEEVVVDATSNYKTSSDLQEPAAAQIKKVHNYAHLFGDLNRITPTTATRFGMLLSRKEDLLQEWRIERIELKEDFKKRLAEGKRRNRRGNSNRLQ